MVTTDFLPLMRAWLSALLQKENKSKEPAFRPCRTETQSCLLATILDYGCQSPCSLIGDSFRHGLRRRCARTIDRSEVLSELQNIRTCKGAVGTIRFDEKGDLVDPEIGMYQCDSGIRKYLGSVRELTK